MPSARFSPPRRPLRSSGSTRPNPLSPRGEDAPAGGRGKSSAPRRCTTALRDRTEWVFVVETAFHLRDLLTEEGLDRWLKIRRYPHIFDISMGSDGEAEYFPRLPASSRHRYKFR